MPPMPKVFRGSATEQGAPDEVGLDPLAVAGIATARRRLAVPEYHRLPGSPRSVRARPAGRCRSCLAPPRPRPVGRQRESGTPSGRERVGDSVTTLGVAVPIKNKTQQLV